MCIAGLLGAPKVKAPTVAPVAPAPPPTAPTSTGVKVSDNVTSTTSQGAMGELLNQGLSSSSLRIPRSTTSNTSSSLNIPSA